MSTYKVDDVNDLNLKQTFECGQCFRWNRQENGSYEGKAMGRMVNMYMPDDNTLLIDPCTPEEFENIWARYLDFDTDYGKIKEEISRSDPKMREAIEVGNGIRILNQDLWETLVSFIISQNNNIPRIKGCIESLCRMFGKKIDMPETVKSSDKTAFYDIPSPSVLASLDVDDLASVKLGYRASYIIEASRQVCERGLPGSYDQLTDLKGVGPKVANCVALFGLGERDCFPIDIWVRRVMNKIYGMDESNLPAMQKFADEHFGSLGGYAQQYLFYYIREFGS